MSLCSILDEGFFGSPGGWRGTYVGYFESCYDFLGYAPFRLRSMSADQIMNITRYP